MNGQQNSAAMVVDLVASPVRANHSARFTPEQEDLIRATCCGGASKSDADALISIAEARGLNPILGECFFVQRENKWSVQASIDSFRIKAEETGLYAGQDEPEYEYDDKGNVALARVRVWRKDWPRPSVGVARFSEYVQTKANGEHTRFWKKMPHNQLAKCAEALAMRKAFPKVLAKLYTAEEMAQADNAEPQVAPRSAPAALPPKQPLITLDEAIFQKLCDLVDEAENVSVLNKIAKDSADAQKRGAITPSQLEKLKSAVVTKRRLIGSTPRPPRSEPQACADEPVRDPEGAAQFHELEGREPGEEG